MRAAKLLCEKCKSQVPAFKSPVGVGCIMPVILSSLPFETGGMTKKKITRLIQNDNLTKTNKETKPKQSYWKTQDLFVISLCKPDI